jgi:voltage-gated potassium channel
MAILPNRKKQKLHEVIFEADTPLGKAFDIFLIWAILASVVVVMLESVSSFDLKYGRVLNALEWIFTIFFTLEYFARIYSLKKTNTLYYQFLRHSRSLFLFANLPQPLAGWNSGTDGIQDFAIAENLSGA